MPIIKSFFQKKHAENEFLGIILGDASPVFDDFGNLERLLLGKHSPSLYL